MDPEEELNALLDGAIPTVNLTIQQEEVRQQRMRDLAPQPTQNNDTIEELMVKREYLKRRIFLSASTNDSEKLVIFQEISKRHCQRIC